MCGSDPGARAEQGSGVGLPSLSGGQRCGCKTLHLCSFYTGVGVRTSGRAAFLTRRRRGSRLSRRGLPGVPWAVGSGAGWEPGTGSLFGSPSLKLPVWKMERGRGEPGAWAEVVG